MLFSANLKTTNKQKSTHHGLPSCNAESVFNWTMLYCHYLKEKYLFN